MPRSRIALETGTHSPWIRRLLSELGHEVIVAHARKVRLIGESREKDYLDTGYNCAHTCHLPRARN
jgi:transposase